MSACGSWPDISTLLPLTVVRVMEFRLAREARPVILTLGAKPGCGDLSSGELRKVFVQALTWPALGLSVLGQVIGEAGVELGSGGGEPW